MANKLKVCMIQLQAGPNKEENLEKARNFIHQAHETYNPDIICFPEAFNFRGKSTEEKSAAEIFPINSNDEISSEGYEFTEEDKSKCPTLTGLAEIARKEEVSIMGGSIFEGDGNSKPKNTSFYINHDGRLVNKYSKIHLFDVKIANYATESNTREFGELDQSNRRVYQDKFDCGQLNLATGICYDLRFPEFFRSLVFNDQGLTPDIIFLPSAFSMATGDPHWEPLIRARAIENTVFVIAPNQVGESASGFACHGNSMVVDPWGRVIARGGDWEEIIYAELDLEQISKVRAALPLDNVRLLQK